MEGKRISIYVFKGKRDADAAERGVLAQRCRLSVQEMTEGE